MRIWPLALTLLVALVAPARASGDLVYVQKVGAGETAIIDTRTLADCKRASLPGARCLPAADLLGAQRQLPTERDLLWLFGTLGLTGEETVLVVGDTASARDFVGGLLHLAGQRQVRILDQVFSPRLAALPDPLPGQERGLLRTAVFTQPMRSDLWLVHEAELNAADSKAVVAPDAYTAIIRFTRQVAAGDQKVRVGWNLSSGSPVR